MTTMILNFNYWKQAQILNNFSDLINFEKWSC